MTDTASEIVRNALINDGDLSGIISTRVYPSSLPSGNKIPCVIYRGISGPPQDFAQDSGGGLRKIRWQFDCWENKHRDAEVLACTLSAALRNSSLGIEIINLFDASPEAELESEGRWWRYIVEAYSWSEEG